MPIATVKKGRARPLWGHHPWVYSGALEPVREEVRPGDLVDVVDTSGAFIGRGYVNPKSSIAVRLLTWDAAEAIDLDFFRRRIGQAIDLRTIVGIPDEATGYRLVNSEGDGLPGLVVDRFGGYLVVQIGTMGMYRMQHLIIQALKDLLSPDGIIARPTAAMARLEGFPPVQGLVAGTLPADEVIIREHGIRYAVDLLSGQKTGFYFDQRDNRQRVAQLARGRRVLDCFCYSGGFSLASSVTGQASGVVGIDSSAPAIELMERNLELNGNPRVTAIVGDVGQVLKEFIERRECFDLVVTDPPKLVKSDRDLKHGLSAYRALNAQAMRVLGPRGLLVACSCSGAVTEEQFERVLIESALASGKDLRIFDKRSQAGDHPVHPACPEGRYLKCYYCMVG